VPGPKPLAASPLDTEVGNDLRALEVDALTAQLGGDSGGEGLVRGQDPALRSDPQAQASEAFGKVRDRADDV
jgi:hypothetical protein